MKKMSKAPHLDQQILKRLLLYDFDAGIFIWHRRTDVGESWNARFAGKRAGHDKKITKTIIYRSICIFAVLGSKRTYAGKGPK